MNEEAIAELQRQIHFLTVGIDAIEGLSVMVPYAMDEEAGVTGEQVGHILKCVEYSLLRTQQNIVAASRDLV